MANKPKISDTQTIRAHQLWVARLRAAFCGVQVALFNTTLLLPIAPLTIGPLTMTYLAGALLLTGCSVSELLSDDDEDETDSLAEPETPVTEPPANVALTADNYALFLSIALRARPSITFDALPLGRFPTYNAVDQTSLSEDGATTTITHACEIAAGTAVTTQFRQLPAEGEAEPLFGSAGDFSRTEFNQCLRDNVTHDGIFDLTLSSHSENATPANITDFVVFVVSNSIETFTFTNHTVTDAISGDSVLVNGTYAETKRRVSEQNFINSAERTDAIYLDKITATNFTVTTNFTAGENINDTFVDFSLSENDDSIQWSGDIQRVINSETYALTITNVSELQKSLTDEFYSSGSFSLSDGISWMGVAFTAGGQASITLDIDFDGEIELETIQDLSQL